MESLAFGISVMPCGVALCVYPWFFDSLLWLSMVGDTLLAALFLTEF